MHLERRIFIQVTACGTCRIVFGAWFGKSKNLNPPPGNLSSNHELYLSGDRNLYR